jgi:hypothetical protein
MELEPTVLGPIFFGPELQATDSDREEKTLFRKIVDAMEVAGASICRVSKQLAVARQRGRGETAVPLSSGRKTRLRGNRRCHCKSRASNTPGRLPSYRTTSSDGKKGGVSKRSWHFSVVTFGDYISS